MSLEDEIHQAKFDMQLAAEELALLTFQEEKASKALFAIQEKRREVSQVFYERSKRLGQMMGEK